MDQTTWTSRSLVFFLVAILVVSPGVTAKDGAGEDKEDPGPVGKPVDQETYGWVIVPTHPAARLFSPMSATGVTHFFLEVTPRATFALDTTDALRMNGCTLSVCVSSGDFDIVFFEKTGQGGSKLLGRFVEDGAESGEVPRDADFAVVYLKTPGTSPDARGFKFLYKETLGAA